MPKLQKTETKISIGSEKDYCPRLSNADLVPARQKNWNWYNIFSFWMSDVHSMGGYVVAASFFTLGLTSWQILVCLLLGILFVQMCANLVAKPSQMTGVPYAVICRQAFGVFGANIPAVIRGIVAMAWYGVQTWLASNALMLAILKFWPSAEVYTLPNFLGLSLLGWACFLTLSVLQALIFWRGMNTIKHFIDIAGPAVYVVMLALAGWIIYQTGFSAISLTLNAQVLSLREQCLKMLTAIALVISYFAAPLLNYGDFSRYAKDMQAVKRGNRWGLPFNFTLFSIVTVIIVSGTQTLYGEMLTDPIETVKHIDNKIAIALGVLTIIIATVGINIVANFVSAAFDFSNCSPQHLSYRKGGMIAAIGSIIITPWNLFNSPQLIHYSLDILGAFIGPLFAILLTDFYLIKRQEVVVDALFNSTAEGIYWYRQGVNLKAVFALIPAALIGITLTIIPELQMLASFNWFIGAGIASSTYYWLARKTPISWRQRLCGHFFSVKSKLNAVE